MNHEKIIIGQLNEMQKQHKELLKRLENIRIKIALLLSNQGEKINIIKSNINVDILISGIESIIKSIEQSIEKYKNSDKDEVKNTFDKYKSTFESLKIDPDKNLSLLETLKNNLEEMNINLFGKIKVYMKIKPNLLDNIIIDSSSSKIINGFLKINNDETIQIEDEEKFGPFSKILFKPGDEEIKKYKNIIKNKDLFDELSGENSPLNINNLLGISTILFGYGISGSGKSWTMLGGKDDQGLIPLLIDYLSGNGFTVKPYKIFEHYLDSDDFIETDGSTPYFIEEKLKSKIRNFKINEYSNNSVVNFTKLDDKRKSIESIKKTPNNDKSSRTHLFIIYEITKESEKGYITFIDSAGKEEPLEITKQFYTKSEAGKDIKNPALPFVPKPDNYSKNAAYMRLKVQTLDNFNLVKQIIREGFFINESLAHMIYYFSGENIAKETMTNRKKIDNPNYVSTYTSYNTEEKLNVFHKPPKPVYINTLTDESKSDPVFITTIFDYLTNLCNEKNKPKKFKFVMIGNTRTEKEYKGDITKTLKLINLLKST